VIELKKCDKCGIQLPADAPQGICPKCLIGVGLQAESAPERDESISDPQSPTATCAGPSFTPPDVGVLFEKFPQLEILEPLGHGGMGAVYKARQKNLDRLVALKIIRPEVTQDSTFAERFNREAKTLARLSHQNIVTVHDFGEIDFSEDSSSPAKTLYYFIMEIVEGANLRQLMQTGDLSPDQALAIVPQICTALQYAHEEGVVHRDIKPENILLDKQGNVKIADFGLAKLANSSAEMFTLTGTHQVMGTPRYMAPEQMEGSHSVDRRADIYSLGVVFYEMLTGEPPVGHFELPSKKANIDVRLDEVVLRSLAQDPERRYQNASEVKKDVETISGSVPSAARGTAKVNEKQNELPPGMGPRLLLISGGLLASALVVAAGIAFLAVAFIRESPGSQAFWGWMGSAFGCAFGGLGSLFGTWNSYRQLEGAPNLMDSPQWTIFDWAMAVYSAAGVVAMGAAWILSFFLPWYPAGYSLTLIGGIVLFQGVLFMVIRGLQRRAAQQESAALALSESLEIPSGEE